MADGNFVAYFRVSTARQGRSGLGLEAQRAAVDAYLNGGNWKIVAAFTEVESGKRADRPELEKALQACRVHKARLVIAKLDRLSRDAHFLLGLQKAGVDFVAADNPHANRLTIHILAAVAEDEARRISERTKAALAAAKARGVRLGTPRRDGVITDAARARSAARRAGDAAARAADLLPIIEELRAAGAASLRALAAGLDARGITTPRGAAWTPTQVARVLVRASATA